MVDVGAKPETHRVAVAEGRLLMAAATLDALRENRVPKGDPLLVARIAGIQAAKRTADLIPLCGLPPGPAQDPARDFLTEVFRTRTQAEWMDWMAGRDIAFAPVRTLREGLDDPQTRHRDMVVEDARGWEHLGMPHKFAAEPGRVSFDLPALGQHSEEILRSLGYSDADLAAMKADGVC